MSKPRPGYRTKLSLMQIQTNELSHVTVVTGEFDSLYKLQVGTVEV